MTAAESRNAIMVGAPPDGERFTEPDIALVQLQIDGPPHRCIRTTATRQIGGQRLQTYNYDGGTR
jgi:hypothetical protein